MTEETPEKKQEEVAWNLSQQIMMILGNLRGQANYHFLSGNVAQACKVLQAIRMTIIQNLNKEEREQFSKIEKELSGLGIVSRFHNADEIEYATMDHKQAVRLTKKWVVDSLKMQELYEKYNTMIMDCLEKYGYLVKKADDLTVLHG